MNERRSTTRVQLNARVDISLNSKVIAAATEICDLSLDAVAFVSEIQLPVGSECSFTITVSGPTSLLQISGNGKVVRQHETKAVVRFSELEMDSYLHLKNLILLNRTPKEP